MSAEIEILEPEAGSGVEPSSRCSPAPEAGTTSSSATRSSRNAADTRRAMGDRSVAEPPPGPLASLRKRTATLAERAEPEIEGHESGLVAGWARVSRAQRNPAEVEGPGEKVKSLASLSEA